MTVSEMIGMLSMLPGDSECIDANGHPIDTVSLSRRFPCVVDETDPQRPSTTNSILGNAKEML